MFDNQSGLATAKAFNAQLHKSKVRSQKFYLLINQEDSVNELSFYFFLINEEALDGGFFV
jgi:hypothetical protein